jgi:alkylation response protein AidB-like acyl-CoA dehydrogenase
LLRQRRAEGKVSARFTDGTDGAAYCSLTELGSGSDAPLKTKAVLNAEGTHYALNGQDYERTSVSADVTIVFAQTDGDKFIGFYRGP